MCRAKHYSFLLLPMIKSFQVTQQLSKRMLLLEEIVTVTSVLIMNNENLLADQNVSGLSPKEFDFLRLAGMGCGTSQACFLFLKLLCASKLILFSPAGGRPSLTPRLLKEEEALLYMELPPQPPSTAVRTVSLWGEPILLRERIHG